VNDHERILLLAAAAIDFPLALAETDELEAHLRSCTDCRSAAARLRGDAAQIASLPRRRLSDEVERRIVEAARGARPTGFRPSLVLIAAALLLAATLIGAAVAGALLLRTRELPFSLVPPSARVTAVPTSVAPTPTSTAAPSPTRPPGETWQVVTGTPSMSDLVAGGPGWVGVGGGAWTSSDGRTWTPATVDGSDSAMTAVAAGPGGYVAIGENHPTDAQGSGQIWFSADGLDWQIVGSGPAFELGPCIEGCPSMIDVAGGPKGFVAFGYRTGGATVAWFSSDGQRWETLPARTFEVAGSAVSPSGIAAGPSGFVIAGSIGSPGSDGAAFWLSPDGRIWTHTGPDRTTKPIERPFAVVAGGPGFVAVGDCWDGDKICGATAWTSPDGAAWTQRTIDASELPAFAGAAASDGDRVVAFSDAGTAVWTSDDGLTWTRHEVDAAPVSVQAAAGGDRGFIAIGLDETETVYSAWLSP
jgi:hypothetical protein